MTSKFCGTCRVCGGKAKYGVDGLCLECSDSLTSAAIANCTEDEDEDRYCQLCGEFLYDQDHPYYCNECLEQA